VSSLRGKVAVVTGGCKGIGRGIVDRFLSDGAKLVVCDTDARPQRSDDLLFVRADVSRPKDMEATMAEAVSAFGGIDILANCAGIQRYGTVVDTPEEVWDAVMAVNLKGIFLASKYAVPEMTRRGGGSIINIASVQAYASQAGVAAYTASKGAIVSLTRAMALDHADAGIRVNAVCPASIDTPMLRWAADLWKGKSTTAATLKAWGKAHPVGRIGLVSEVAAVAALLAGDECPFMTGADIKVDGGVLSKLAIELPDQDASPAGAVTIAET
jgi:NAD(P)-dependent dehydrogenase (short-subunit alcohol dehydrogenase family)